MRTDSVRVADSAVAQARDFIKREFGKRYLPDEPVVHKGGKSNARVQDAHEAIRPTDVLRRPEELKKHLDARQLKLYQLIWRRFVASQMTPAVFETTKRSEEHTSDLHSHTEIVSRPPQKKKKKKKNPDVVLDQQ